MLVNLRKPALAAALVLSACAGSLPAPDQPGAAQAYRAELAKDPKGDRVKPLREGLEAAEYESAKRAHTILAYRRFLSEFPGSPFTVEARARLEALRWNEAEAAGSDSALAGFLADEPAGAHAAEAWEKLAALRLQAALKANTEESLRGWLQANPTAAGRDQAMAALDEAQFAAVQQQAGSSGLPGLRAYLADHPEGRHRAQAQQRLLEAEIAEAALLEDEQRLGALARSGGAAAARTALEAIRSARTAALDPEGGDERTLAAAHALFLPQPTSEELPADAVDRARVLRSWAVAADGARLGRLLTELGATRAQVGLTALESAQDLIAALPPAERQARATRLLESLRPKAQAPPLLVAVSLLEEAAGHQPEALAQARAGLSRDRTSLVAGARAVALEAAAGDPPLALFAVQTLLTAAQAWTDVHADAASPLPDRLPDGTALLELCASAQVVRVAAAALAHPRLAAEPGVTEAKGRAARIAASIASRLAEGEQIRQAARKEFTTCAALSAESAEAASLATGRRRAAVHELLAAGPLGRAALERARRRDPDPEVQRLLNSASARSGAERAAAKALR